MKKEWYRVIAALLAVTLIVVSVAACGKSNKESADSLIASETYVPATVQAIEDEELAALVEEVIGGEWDGDFGALTPQQRLQIQKKMIEKGYNADISEDGISYYSYTPTADKAEIADAAKTALGDKDWNGSYADLNDDEKVAVRDELRKRGYDAEIGEQGFEFLGEADRKEQTTKYSYDRLPTQEQIISAVADEIGSSAALKWNGDMLTLTPEQQKAVLKALNDYGFDLALNEKGEFYMVHKPENKVTYNTAYTDLTQNGTTQPPTTIRTTEPEKLPETGTSETEKITAPAVERTALSTFGGTDGDSFRHVVASKDGGYIVTAQFRSKNGDFAGTDTTWEEEKSAVIKYNKDGEYQWKATLGGKKLINRNGVFLRQSAELTDGSIVSVGDTGASSLGAHDVMDALMVCYDANGSRKWLKLFAGSSGEVFDCVCATPDGGFIAGGRTLSSDGDFADLQEGTNKAILVKFSADGTKEWIQAFSSGTNAAHYVALAVTDAGYIYAACQAVVAAGMQMQLDMLTYAGYGGSDSIVFKFDPNGTLLNHFTIAGSGHDLVESLTLADGGVLVCGQCTSNNRADSVFVGKHNNGGYDAFLIRLSATLEVEWVKTFGGVGSDSITGVAQIKGGYAAVGWSTSTDNAFSFLGSGGADVFVLTLSENGSDVTKTPLNGTKSEQALGVVSRDGRQFAVVGHTQSSTNLFSGLTPAPEKAAIAFFSLFRVK